MSEQKQTYFNEETGVTEFPEAEIEETIDAESTVEDISFDDVDRESVRTDAVLKERKAFEESAIALNTEYAQMLPKELPIGLKQSLANVPDKMKLPVICGILPLAAAYATDVRFRYCDGKFQRLNLMSIIYGRQASGKSSVRDVNDLWVAPMKWQDEVAREEEESFKRLRKNRKANEKLPEEPKPLIRNVPITISCSTLLKRLKNSQGQHLYSFGEELGTLQKTNGAGSWSSKYDIYRLSFDNGSWGQDYNSDQAESGVVDVAYNWTVLGTLGAIHRCFKADSVENGMCGRVLFAQMPSEFFGHMPEYREPRPVDSDKIIEAVEILKAKQGDIELPRLSKMMREWADKKADEAKAKDDIALDTMRKRAAVIGFRAGVIYYLLQNKSNETESCLKFAEIIAEYCLANQMAIFGTQLSEVLRENVVNTTTESPKGAFQKAFVQLPETFTLDDILKLLPYMTRRNASANVSRMIKQKLVNRVGTKRFAKTTEGKNL